MEASHNIMAAHAAARLARMRAYAPYSKFQVGAVVVDSLGEIFSGCNVENASYGGTVCAERVALLKAVSEGRSGFTDVVVVTDATEPATPCALCLQTMAEFLSEDANIWIGDLSGIYSRKTLRELLPFPFGPHQLASAKIPAK